MLLNVLAIHRGENALPSLPEQKLTLQDIEKDTRTAIPLAHSHIDKSSILQNDFTGPWISSLVPAFQIVVEHVSHPAINRLSLPPIFLAGKKGDGPPDLPLVQTSDEFLWFFAFTLVPIPLRTNGLCNVQFCQQRVNTLIQALLGGLPLGLLV